jgi:hypothetical protein
MTFIDLVDPEPVSTADHALPPTIHARRGHLVPVGGGFDEVAAEIEDFFAKAAARLVVGPPTIPTFSSWSRFREEFMDSRSKRLAEE